MSNYYLSIFYCLLLLNMVSPLQCQELVAYQPLYKDTTSIGVPRKLAQKALQLQAELSQDLQDQFIVFSTSEQIMEQHIPDDFERTAVSRTLRDTFKHKSPYFLSFHWVRTTNYQKVRAYVHTYLKLPSQGPFLCVTELERHVIAGGLAKYATSLIPRDKDFTNFEEVEWLVMDSLQALIKNLKACCKPNGRNKCEKCLSDWQINGAYNEFNNRVSHAAKYKKTEGHIKRREKAQELRGANYHITEIEPIFINWEGKEIRLSSLLTEYFTTRAKGVFWETIILPSKICKPISKEQLLRFINKKGEAILEEAQLKKNPEFTHKLMAAIRDDGNLWLKISTDDWMYHPIDLKPIKPVLIGK